MTEKCIKEQRTQEERRSGIDRRKRNPEKYTGIEKRLDPDCRQCIERRDNGKTWIEYQPVRLKK